jgi:hypothetical protein
MHSGTVRGGSRGGIIMRRSGSAAVGAGRCRPVAALAAGRDVLGELPGEATAA